MTVRVRMFASAREVFGFELRDVPVTDPSLEGLKTWLRSEFPSAQGILSSCRFAVNMEYARGDAELKEGDEVAVIPPVSGG